MKWKKNLCDNLYCNSTFNYDLTSLSLFFKIEFQTYIFYPISLKGVTGLRLCYISKKNKKKKPCILITKANDSITIRCGTNVNIPHRKAKKLIQLSNVVATFLLK